MGKGRLNYCAIAAFLFLQTISICSSWPLSTNSRWIVDDVSGQRVKLACVNWPSHLEPMIAEGVEKKPLSETAQKITANGFNCVRFTWATFMFTRPEYSNLKVSESLDKYNLSAARDGIVRNNPQILNMTVVELHKAVVDELGRNKLMVVLDNHISRPGWCCSDNDGNGFFGDADVNPGEWQRGLDTVAKAYKGNPAVVGMSLRNELRGSRQNEADWYKYMRIGANTIHNQNPDFLVIVSGLGYAGNLGFLKSQPLVVRFTNKLVYEAHWYPFGIPANKWTSQTNQLCASVTKATTDNLLFLTQGNNPFPLFLSEFGINQRGDNEADNIYIGCLLAAVAELDLDWALWALQGSYLLREGTVNLEEFDGVLDWNWDAIRNPPFLDRLQVIQQINQDFKSEHPTYYKMLHPLSGHCVQIVENGIVVANCRNASKWEQHQDEGPIKLVGSPQCLGVVVDGEAPRVSEDCSSKWKFVSSSGLHLATQDGNGGYLCLEMNASDSKLMTKKCLCVGDNLVDLPTCADNPQAQWFKFIPANISFTWTVSTTRLLLSSLPSPLSLSHSHTHTSRRSRRTVPQQNRRAKASRSNWSNIPNFKLAFSPKRATAELRHSSSLGNRATPSPSASAVASSPFSSDYNSATAAADDDNGRDRHPRDRSFRSYFQSFFPHFLFPNDDLHRSHSHRSKISIVILVAIVFAAVISVSSLVQRLNAPYLCKKDGITLQCPHVKEPPSLWENPHSATTSWKPCADRREGVISDLPSENSTSGYIFIHAEGGLNQQRIAICNAVAVAKILNATLILPVLKQDQIWKDQTKFEDIFDVDHFIEYLKDDVTIVRDIPEWFTDKAELFSSIRRTVKNIPKYAPAQFYIDNVLPRVKEKKIMALKPFVDRLGYDNVPQEINRLRCRVNYHALKFLPEIENMADLLVSRMRNRTGNSNPFMALHLRFEKGMVGLSFCDFVGTRIEKALMAIYRLKEWPRRFKDGSHLWALALQKRKEGRCPLEPGEVAVMLRAMGYPKETQIYVASGQVYGGQNRMAPLRNMFPNLVTKEELATKLELDEFRKHVTSLAALDFLVCLKSDVFVMTHGGNFAKLIIGNRRYLGHHLKSIKPDKGLMSKSLGDPYMGWATFVEDVITTHQTRSGLPEETFPNYDIWENPLTPCMCRT